MGINDSWNIRPRANECSKTTQSFQDGESFYAAKFKDNNGETYSRLDFSIKAWEEILNNKDKESLFSFWRSKFEEEAPVKAKEVVEKEKERLQRSNDRETRINEILATLE